MPVFSFKAMDRAGKVVTGATEAADFGSLAASLKKSDLFLIKATPQSAAPAVAPPAAERRSGEVELKDISFFTGQLAVMMRNAVPAVEALESLTAREGHDGLKDAIWDIQSRLKRGESLSGALGHHPDLFDEVYVSLVTAGEASGDVPAVLDRIDAHLNFEAELRQRIRSVVLYPLIVVSSAVVVVLFILFFVIPTFVEVFAQFDAPLPLPTRALLAISAHLRHLWFPYLALLIGAGVVARRALRNPKNKARLDKLYLDLPVAGPLVQAVVLTRVLRTLGTLVRGGIPILRALELTRAAAGNAVFQQILDEVSAQVSEGKGLAPALARSPYIPSSIASMVATAEQTGALPQVLDKVSDYYERRTEAAMRDLFTALEPAFVGVLGLIIAGIALCVLLPIFNLGVITK